MQLATDEGLQGWGHLGGQGGICNLQTTAYTMTMQELQKKAHMFCLDSNLDCMKQGY